MSALFERVPFKTEAPKGDRLLHVYKIQGRAVATVTHYRWFETDARSDLSYAELETSRPDSAEEVIARFARTGAEVALESDDLWNPRWGYLR
jgi:hypothetical protein